MFTPPSVDGAIAASEAPLSTASNAAPIDATGGVSMPVTSSVSNPAANASAAALARRSPNVAPRCAVATMAVAPYARAARRQPSSTSRKMRSGTRLTAPSARGLRAKIRTARRCIARVYARSPWM